MIIYHGGTQIVEKPDILAGSRGRDFGRGFYTTSIREQAEKWATRQAVSRRAENAILNIYEYDDANAKKSLIIKRFRDYSLEWLDLVISCRQDGFYCHDYDVVIGKIANDDVGETVQAVLDGLSSKEFALSRLVYMKANDQICFCNEAALKFLRFTGSERVT